MKIIRTRCDLCGKETEGAIPKYQMTYEQNGEEMGGLDLCEKCGEELLAHLRDKYAAGQGLMDRDFDASSYRER